MAEMKDRHVSKAKKLVRDKFPEMAGVEPSVARKRSQSKEVKRGSGAASRSEQHYVFTFEKEVSLPGGGRLKRLVRVTMDESGGVVRLTSSK